MKMLTLLERRLRPREKRNASKSRSLKSISDSKSHTGVDAVTGVGAVMDVDADAVVTEGAVEGVVDGMAVEGMAVEGMVVTAGIGTAALSTSTTPLRSPHWGETN